MWWLSRQMDGCQFVETHDVVDHDHICWGLAQAFSGISEGFSSVFELVGVRIGGELTHVRYANSPSGEHCSST
jgi:hypothetical protein